MTISEAGFRYVADLVHVRTSIRFEPGKEYLVEARLMPLARQVGDPDVDTYVHRLRADVAERSRAVDALTINETSWFRDSEPFRVFTDVMVPDLVGRRPLQRKLRIWSAASSSGQEAYSLAILCQDHLPDDWTVEIVATDVSQVMVDRVRRGCYGQVEMNRGMPATHLVRHFTRAGTEWQVSERLRSVVRAQQLNLAAPFPELGRFDVVFLRNVLIYFDVATKQDILRRLHRMVAPDGYLLLGAAETGVDGTEHWELERHGRTSVHRPRAGTAPATAAPPVPAGGISRPAFAGTTTGRLATTTTRASTGG